jgi:hypothetical protein
VAFKIAELNNIPHRSNMDYQIAVGSGEDVG